MSLTAYHHARTITESPRATEARLLSQVTGEMIDARHRGARGLALSGILFRNRTVWMAFVDACAARGNRLPDALRGQIISLGLWVDRYTSDVIAGRDEIDALIAVNRDIIEGLQMASPDPR